MMDSCSKCPKPDDIITQYISGVTIRALIKQVKLSRIFANSELARGYVYKTIYEHEMLQKKTGFSK